MLRFALLRHDCPPDYRDGPHWDLMFERPGVADEHRLATWALQRLPAAWAKALGVMSDPDAEPVTAQALPDHRAVYLDYEGPVSGDRGSVYRVAGGAIEWATTSTNVVVVRILEPSLLAGETSLRQDDKTAWRLTWQP